MQFCQDCSHYETLTIEEPCLSCIRGCDPTAGVMPHFEPLPALQNPYGERICAMADRQRAKGIETYGQGLESNPADIVKRIEHLQEELIDGLMYCEWIKDELKKMEGFHMNTETALSIIKEYSRTTQEGRKDE